MIGILLTLLTVLGFAFVATGFWHAEEQIRSSRIRVRTTDRRSARVSRD